MFVRGARRVREASEPSLLRIAYRAGIGRGGQRGARGGAGGLGGMLRARFLRAQTFSLR